MKKKYEIIAEQIKSEIENDISMEKLPTEMELMEKYDSCRDTIRSAFNILKAEDLIYSKQGSGYYVKKNMPKIKNLLNADFTITEMVENAGLEIGKRDETIRRIKTDRFANYFDECSNFFVIERIRTAVNMPIAFSRIYLPIDLVGEDFPLLYRSGSLKVFLHDNLNLYTTEAFTRIEAYDVDIDNIPEEFRQLPIIKLTQDNKMPRGKTLLLTEDFVRSDVIELHIHRESKHR